jgi:putative endonuclease
MSQAIGARFEAQALTYLEQAGLCLLARNVRYRVGEIDLIMRDGNTLVFVEVRSRSRSGFGGAAASVGALKRARLIRAAQAYLMRLRGQIPPCRFDVVAFESGRLVWLRNAFGMIA